MAWTAVRGSAGIAGIGCAVGCEYGDPLVTDRVETDGLVHGVGERELIPEFLVKIGTGEGVRGGVKTEVSQVVRFRSERKLADDGVDAVGSDHEIA